MFEIVTQPQGGPFPHIHQTQDEVIYVLEGTFVFPDDDNRIEAGPGACVSIPKGTLHSYKNVGPTPGKMLTLFTPPGPAERFFDDVGVTATNSSSPPMLSDPPAMKKILASAQHNGMEFVLPEDIVLGQK